MKKDRSTSRINTSQSTHLVLFDGVCNLCNGFVQFLIRQDKQGLLTFGSLQGLQAQQLLAQNGIDNYLASIVYLRKGKAYKRSSAALYILKDLGSWWWITQIFWIIPKPLRDICYDWVGRNRYRWFGKKQNCMVPSPELKNRFLES
jgi:predicted DCC family thiol-disulfide oxidoreductase YuxK